ncbi:hypothetical protein PF004_g13247 [Phytophthora fragariae]|uniref:Uncharacterized protein n=1 Tax=Phytophthora fragariae TaxID=53985 RepID=A0A6G0NSR0_9STRA|nr:hypothetical protein PF004_g13247 [Phytophthora fragariae]
MTGNGKFKAQANGKERTVVSTDDCLPKDVRVNESEADDAPMPPGEQSFAGEISLQKIRLEDKHVDSA